MLEFKKSTNKNKKYMVKTPKGKWIHFGAVGMEQYKDTTGLGLYSKYDHLDKERRRRYLSRAKGIKTKDGKLTWNNPESANFYSVKFLW
jgi:hypothetical protein